MLDFDSFTSALNLKHKLGGITRHVFVNFSRLARIGYFNSVDTEEHVIRTQPHSPERTLLAKRVDMHRIGS